jgi:hypothetical protein
MPSEEVRRLLRAPTAAPLSVRTTSRLYPRAHATASAMTMVAVSSQLMCGPDAALPDAGPPSLSRSHGHWPDAQAPAKLPVGRRMKHQPQEEQASVSMVMSGGNSAGAGRTLTPE